MSDFPSTKNEALTMLYLQNQDLSGLTPKQLLDKYEEVYKEICKYKPRAKTGTIPGGI